MSPKFGDPVVEPWVHRAYLKDGKLRVRERYFRQCARVEEATEDIATKLLVVPDALVLRKFFPCIQRLLNDNSVRGMKWILLESVAEYLDYRNQSPVLDGGLKEAAAPRERHVLENKSISAFCDLSIRDNTDDEWDFLGYDDMDIHERSRNALLRAAGMLQSGQMSLKAEVIVVSEQFDSTGGEEVKVVTFPRLLKHLENTSFLTPEVSVQLIAFSASCSDAYHERNRPKEISPSESDESDKNRYLSLDSVEEGIRSGALHCGRLVVTKDNVREAYVSVGPKKYFIDLGKGNNNRAFHDDRVVILPLPENEWSCPLGRRRLVHNTENSTIAADETDSLLVNEAPAFPSARVVSIREPGRRVFVATLVEMPRNNEGAHLFVPMDRRIPKIRVVSRQDFINKRILVQVDEWEVGSTYPTGHCKQILGPIGNINTEIQALLHETQVNLEPFSLAAQACLPPEGNAWKIPDTELKNRRDLRKSRRVFSVDPAGCQDIDDTMHAEVLPNGDIEIGVHIADVTFFVEHESPLDIEAQKRGTTFYLVDRRFDMLPAILSSNLCSLHGGMDRLAVSSIFVFSPDLKQVKSTWFGRSIIHNCAAMTYDQADRVLCEMPPEDPDSPPPPELTAGSPVDAELIDSLKADLEILTRLARKLRTDREEIGGAVDLSSGDLGSELKFVLSSGLPKKVTPKEDKEIHHTIAEMMIMANSAVAEKIYGYCPTESLLRIHQSVEEDRFQELHELLIAANVQFDGSTNKSLAESLKEAENRGSSFVQSLLKSLATRAMSEAKYVCTEGKRDAGLSHYGLGLQHYTHFTSPIRRYADIIVHKQLLVAVTGKGRETVEVPPYGSIETGTILRLPQSNVMSVLNGSQKATTDERNPGVECLLTVATNEEHKSELEPALDHSSSVLSSPAIPYSSRAVTSICEGLNLHNRLAKHASKECQNLFLSYFFKDRMTVERGIVAEVRSNGFICYVPKFDLRAPVFLLDVHGVVQTNPAFLDLPPDEGLPATSLFGSIPEYRRMIGVHLSVSTVDPTRSYIELSSKRSRRAMRLSPLDEVQVSISSPNWDARARIPSPVLHLVSNRVAASFSKENVERIPKSEVMPTTVADSEQAVNTSNSPLFNAMTTKLSPNLRYHPFSGLKRDDHVKRLQSIHGRLVFGNFVNPDTLFAEQKASQQIAAEQAASRRAKAAELSSRANEYNEVTRIQREATLRQQRLAAGKRNARFGKKN